MSYKPQVKESYTLELSSDELGVIRFLLHKAVEKQQSDVWNFRAMAKCDKDAKPVWKSAERDLKIFRKTNETLETPIKTLKY